MKTHASRRPFLVALILSFAIAAPAQNVGSVQGTVADPSGAVIPGATVTITSAISGYRQSATTDSSGNYRFNNVPYAAFTVHAEAAGFTHRDATGELRSNVPVVVNLQLPLGEAKTEVTVTEQAPLLETTSSATHHDLDYVQLEKLPMVQPNRGMSAIVQTVPGVVQDDNGRMHARGSESQVQYVIDGVPVTENLAGIFSTALDTSNLRSTEIITGNIPAEYGDKVSAVVNLNTKSGMEMPWMGSMSLGGGSFESGNVGADFGGHFTKFGVFMSADSGRTTRYLDPPEIANFHNTGGTARFFSRFDFTPTNNDTLRLSLSFNGSDFQVPNRLEQQLLNQDQSQELRDNSQSLGWNHVFNPTTVADLVLFRRDSSARLLDSRVTGFPFFAEQHRRMRNEGVRVNLSRAWGPNTIKVGVEAHRLPIFENFSLAATDPAILADPTNPVSRFTLASPFLFRQNETGHSAAAYAQDRVTLFDRLTLDFGLRFDHYDVVAHDDAWSPRVGFAYHVKRTGTVFRASYNRLFQSPPIENILLSSSPQAAVLSPLAASNPVRVVPPERDNFYEVGIQQQIGSYLRLDISRYVKTIRNFSDKDQLLETGIIFPVAIARGDVRGTEVRLDLAAIRGWTAFISYANSKSMGTTPLVGGLFLGDAADPLLIPGTQFPNDHDQRNTGQFGVTYTHKTGAWATFTSRYDSGVPADFDVLSLPGLDPRIQRNLDPERGRVKPRFVADIAMGCDLFKETRFPVGVDFSVNNLFNRFYLFNFESVFSGTHIGRPREITARLVFHWKSLAGAVRRSD